VTVNKVAIVLFAAVFPSQAVAEPLGGGTKVAQFRANITSALGLRADVKSELVDIVTKHIDSTGEWSLRYMTGKDLYGDQHLNKTIRYFTAVIVKDGRTVVDTLTYDSRSGQLILSEVENIVLSVAAGIDDSKKMEGDAKYEKISESASSTIFHKKGFLQDVAYSVNTKTNAIVKTYSDVFKETIVSTPASGLEKSAVRPAGR
jgi:hypothetical protein